MKHKRSLSGLMLAMLALLAVSLSGTLSVAAQSATP